MAAQDILNLGAENLVTASIDHVLDAIEDPHKSLCINRSDIARMPVAVSEVHVVCFGDDSNIRGPP